MNEIQTRKGLIYLMKYLRQINQAIARIEEWLLIGIVLFMVVLAFLQVLLRNIFDQSFLWGDPLLRHLVLWVGFIGASLATKGEKHINIDVLGRAMKGKMKLAVHLITDLFAMFISAVLTNAAWQFVMLEKEFDSMAFGTVPAWYFQIIIPIGFGLMSLRFLFLSLGKVNLLFSKEGAER